jgi:nucleotide-binding universal stress UspA family protein
LRRYCSETLAHLPAGPRTTKFRYAVGDPATEIVRAAYECNADLIVMSSHGRRGIRKMVFGSTTERVLRQTHVPVLIAPASRMEAPALSELAGRINEVIAPVDLTTFSARQIKVAAAIADATRVPLALIHVLKPENGPVPIEKARTELAKLQALVASRVPTECLVLSGEPSQGIVELAASRDANLIVMGLHSSGMLGPRMGSVTYRVLSATNAFVLALPPHVAARAEEHVIAEGALA